MSRWITSVSKNTSGNDTEGLGKCAETQNELRKERGVQIEASIFPKEIEN